MRLRFRLLLRILVHKELGYVPKTKNLEQFALAALSRHGIEKPENAPTHDFLLRHEAFMRRIVRKPEAWDPAEEFAARLKIYY